MSTPARRQSSVERFLGASAAAPGPFAVLGLAPELCTDEHILAALERQLQRIEMHPEGDTPAADEVRLALHAAAAQLLDTTIRQQLIVRWRDAGAPTPHGPAANTPLNRAGLEHDAVLTMAQYGGWNKESLRRLALLASARGLPSNAVADTLRQLSKSGPSAAAPAPTPLPTAPVAPRPAAASQAPRPSPVPSAAAALPPPLPPPAFPASAGEEPATSKNRELLIVAAVLGVAAVALITLLGIVIVVTSKPVPQQSTPPGQTSPAAPAANQPAPPAPPAQPAPPSAVATPAAPAATPPPEVIAAARFSDVHEAIRALRAAAEEASTEPDKAAETFTAAVQWLGGWWCRLEVGQLRAANDAVVEYVYAIAKWPEAAESSIDALARSAAPFISDTDGIATSEVWPAAWATGMLVRLTRERDLPADLASRIDRALDRALGVDRPRSDPSFTTGTVAALSGFPLRLITGAPDVPGRPGPSAARNTPASSVEPALRRWTEALAAAAGDPLVQERLLIDGLEQILVSAPEPDASARVFEAIQVLAVEIRWRRAGPARARLVEWFRDPRISSGDLNVLTNAMATGSAAEGVGPAMVLKWGAAQHDRERIRADYAAAWGIAEAAARDETAQVWAEAARHAITLRTPGSASPVDALAAASELALLNQAARTLWAGDSGLAEQIVEQAGEAARLAMVPPDTGPRGRSLLRPGDSSDGQWALAFISVGQNRQLRLERIAELENAGMVSGPADAETLVEAACFASPSEVRAAAQRVVMRLAREPVIVNAMLEVLPKAPRIESISTMIEVIGGQSLPRPSDPDWMLQARRGLVERLAELLAAGNDGFGAFDRVAGVLRSAYGATDAELSGAATGPDGPASELTGLWRTWRAEAEVFAPNPHAPAPLEKIVSRRAGRASISQGPVQAWAAEQAGLAELLAYIVSGERPSRAPRVREVMADMARERRAAAHVFEQIRITEQAMLRLWLLRLGKDSEWSGG